MAASERERVVLIGGVGGAREHAIARAIAGGPQWDVDFYTTAKTLNPGIEALSSGYVTHDETDIEWAAEWTSRIRPDFAFIGSEQPLVAGIVNRLANYGIPAVGPTKEAAQIEGSKLFMRTLMSKYKIPGNVEYYHIKDPDQHRRILEESSHEFALKPIGLTGGKGVKVMGEQLLTIEDAVAYGNQILGDKIGGKEGFLLERKETGPEFVLQVFTDGTTVVPMPLVRDYKKAYEGDIGPNTGSMGSYSQEDGLLPFVDAGDFSHALLITKELIAALKSEGIKYKGILYSQFMKTKDGIKVIEENCRFGDPEAVNSLIVLKNKLSVVSQAIIAEHLSDLEVQFEPRATVVRYIAPPGYPNSPEAGVFIGIDDTAIRRNGGHIFFGQVEPAMGGVLTTLSRTAAVAAGSDTIYNAERKVSESMQYITGRYHTRNDIGTEELLQKDKI